MFRKQDTKIHFVGIGGMGMCGIAEVLANMGYRVSGSDMNDTEITRHLTSIGCAVTRGHRADHLGEADVVVVSSAIKGYNPEVEAARARQIPVIPRAEMLGELMRMKYGLAVAGAHGKTTTTTMLHTVLMAAGLDPTAVIGGRVNSLGLANARWGKSDYLVAEADESDGSFLRLTPTIAVVTNIDPEHLDFYGSHEALKEAFVEFTEKVPFYGLAVLCLDHPHVQELLPRIKRRHVTYGFSPQADYHARSVEMKGLSASFVAYRRTEPLGEFTLRMPGRHNVLNTLAALAVADELEVPLDVTKAALASFNGVARRFTIVAEVSGISLVDDYGHHPAEVQATLAAARGAYPGRVIVAFQPHRYSRTELLFDEFTRAFNNADVLFLVDIYAAGEKPIAGVSAERLAQGIAEHGHHAVSHVKDRATLPDQIARIAEPGDVVIALGAGDINKILPAIATELNARFAQGGSA